jgi:hypothetical protein
MQPPSSAPDVLNGYDDVDGFLPDLSTSQATISSTQDSLQAGGAQISLNNKRTYEEDVEETLDAFFGHGVDADNDDDSQTSSMTRPIAKVRAARKNERSKHVRASSGFDFGEASFLTPMDGIEDEY